MARWLRLRRKPGRCFASRLAGCFRCALPRAFALDFGQPQKVALEKIAPGVVVAGGTSHQTLIIEMKDHLMIVEAPLYEERSVAVIGAIKETFPTKPIRYVVVTHFHSDHTGGLRAYAAEGATVIGHSSILPFLQSVLTSPKTVKPDTLALMEAKTGKPQTKLEGIETMREFTDGTRAVRIYLRWQRSSIAPDIRRRIRHEEDVGKVCSGVDGTVSNGSGADRARHHGRYFRERQRVQFRAEFFNALNRPNFGLPNRTVFTPRGLSGNTGRITDLASSSREIQLGLRYTF